jgi:hypothetical protein
MWKVSGYLPRSGLTGMRVGHSTQQRLVGRQSFECAEAKQGVSEVSIDGGKVHLRDLVESDSPWQDYKAVRVQGIYYNAFFQDNDSLIDYLSAQRLLTRKLTILSKVGCSPPTPLRFSLLGIGVIRLRVGMRASTVDSHDAGRNMHSVNGFIQPAPRCACEEYTGQS